MKNRRAGPHPPRVWVDPAVTLAALEVLSASVRAAAGDPVAVARACRVLIESVGKQTKVDYGCGAERG